MASQRMASWARCPRANSRNFWTNTCPSEAALEAEADTEDALALAAAGDPQAALAKLHEALALDPNNDDARYDYVKLLIEMDMMEEAEAALAPTLAYIPKQLRFEALGQFVAAIRFVLEDDRGTWEMAQFDALIAANKRDFDARLAKARVLMVGGDWTAAMDELLEIIMRDKAWNDALPRKIFVAILELLTPPKPKAAPTDASKSAGGIQMLGKVTAEQDPQAELVASYRRKLSMALN